jgi:spoIIIJ-associated protein
LQLLVNQIISKQLGSEKPEEFKRVIIDVANWRKSKEEELAHKARQWAEQVKEEGQDLELDPMPSWQRRIIHMTIGETEGVESESVGEGPDRHLIIRPSKV